MPHDDGRLAVVIRDLDQAVDMAALRACTIELQDHEQRLDPRMPGGAEIADAYVTDMLDRCTKHRGKILLAEIGGEIAGYVVVLTEVRSEDLEDGDMEFGLVADVLVREGFRRRGIGRRLIEAAQAHAVACGVQWLRIGVLAANREARDLYASLGFADYALQLEKRVAGT